jgi:Phosphohydrolase-associated domain
VYFATIRQVQAIRRLFEIYLKAPTQHGGLHVFPSYYKDAIEADENRTIRRIVVDLIAGMTDAQALAMPNRLIRVAVQAAEKLLLLRCKETITLIRELAQHSTNPSQNPGNSNGFCDQLRMMHAIDFFDFRFKSRPTKLSSNGYRFSC